MTSWAVSITCFFDGSGLDSGFEFVMVLYLGLSLAAIVVSKGLVTTTSSDRNLLS